MPRPCIGGCFKPRVVNKGYFVRASDGKRIPRYLCRTCHKQFSAQSFALDYRQRKRRINQQVFRLLAKGVSQRGCADLLAVKPATIARRVVRFGVHAQRHLERRRVHRAPLTHIMLDELETFEHSKCKPVTVPIAIEAPTRMILALSVGRIAAKGPLAEIARRKYGPRPCERSACLERLFQDLKTCSRDTMTIRTDDSPHYPGPLHKHFPKAQHFRYPGRRAAIIGQGELKRGRRDPLFAINHTFAMFRDNVKTLARKTWCTSKRLDRLSALLFIYAHAHNERRLKKKGRIYLRSCPVPT